MSDSNAVFAPFEGRGYRTGRILLLDPAAATELVEAARAQGVRVLGLDGFLVSSQGIQPLQQYDVDLEDDPAPHEAASEFLSNFVGGGLMFEVSLEGNEDGGVDSDSAKPTSPAT